MIAPKENRNMKIHRSGGSLSIDMPTCGRAYMPKVNMRRPGNFILVLFLLVLFALLFGLSMAETHHYGGVHMVVNVASISALDLRTLAGNQVLIPTTKNTHTNFDIGAEDRITLDDVNSTDDRMRRDQTTLAPVRTFRRDPLPLEQAKAILNSIPMDWPVNGTITEVIQEWNLKHTLMTKEQNLALVRHLLDHFTRKRDAANGILISFYGTHSRVRRSVHDCADKKQTSLRKNNDDRRSVIHGYELMSVSTSCNYLLVCDNGGYPTEAGCETNGLVINSSLEYHISDEGLNKIQSEIPDPSLEDYCEFGPLMLTKCNEVDEHKIKVLFYKVQGRSGFWIEKHSLTIGPLFSKLSDFSCSGNASSRCEGDDIFKNLYEESGADDQCYCKASSKRHLVYVTINGVMYRVDYAFYDYLTVKKNLKSREEIRCNNCEITCNNGQISIDYEHGAELIELCHGRFCMDLKNNHRFTVPLSLAALGNSYKYYIRFEDDKEMEGIIQCRIEELCPLIDCHLCIEKLKNPHCYNVIDKVNFIIIVLTWFLLLAIIVKVCKIGVYAIKVMVGIMRAIYKMIFYLLRKILKRCGYDLSTMKITLVKESKLKDGTTVRTEQTKKKTTISRLPPTYIQPIVVMCLLLPLVLGCSETQTMDAKQLDCVMEGGDLKCSTKSTAAISVAPVGQSSCFIFNTADGRTAGTLTIKTISLNLMCNKDVLYWTFNGRMRFNQVCFCTASASNMGNSDTCNDFNRNNRCSKPLNCPSGLVVSGCKTAAGGWEEGCFSYASKYCYYYYKLENDGGATYEVSRCSSFYFEANVEVRIQTIDKDEVIKGKINPGSKLLFPGGTLQLTGASVPPIPILSSCFVRGAHATYIADCVKGTGMVAGKIGEIQCKNSRTAANPNPQDCSFSKNIGTVGSQGGSLVFNYQTMQPRNLKKRLPIVSGGYMVKERGGSISASLNFMALMNFKVTISGLTLVPYSTMSKCSVKFSSIKGCVSCLTGSIISLRVKSDSGIAKAVLSCPSLKADLPFRISETEELIQLNSHFEIGAIKETCVVKCPGNEVKVDISAALTSDVEVTKLFEDHLEDMTYAATTWMKGFFGQFDYLIIIPLVAVLIIGSLIVIKMLAGWFEADHHYKRW